MGSIWSKALDYLMQNARVLWEAPLVIAVVGLLAFALAYWVNGLRYQGALDQKAATVESLKTQIDGLQDRIKDLQQRLAERPPPHPDVVVDPDGVFQFKAQVGTAHLVQVDEASGIVRMASITGAARLNINQEFTYRTYVLKVKSIGMEGTSTIVGQINRMLQQVVCEIVGRTAG